MKFFKYALITLCIFCPFFSYGQDVDNRRLYKLKIQRADPQLIYLLLRGLTDFDTSPEISALSIPNITGGGFGSGFGGGSGSNSGSNSGGSSGGRSGGGRNGGGRSGN